MPYTEKQHRLFEAAQHDPEIAREHGLSQKEARKLAHEGVKKDEKDEKDASQHPGGDTATENEEPSSRRAKHASVGFVDLSPVFNRGGSR